MQNFVSPAIIMRIKEYGETDLLVTFFTPDKGQIKGVAKGARKSRKRFVNSLDIFSFVRLEYGLKREGALYFLHSGKLIDSYPGLRSDYGLLSKASYMVELTEALFPPGVPDTKMFDLLKEAYVALAKGELSDIIPVIFEIRAMALGGYGIHLEKCCICRRPYTGRGAAVFIREKGGIACLNCRRESVKSPSIGPVSLETMNIMQSDWLPEVLNIHFDKKIIEEIRPVLRLHREYRLEKPLKTSKFVE